MFIIKILPTIFTGLIAIITTYLDYVRRSEKSNRYKVIIFLLIISIISFTVISSITIYQDETDNVALQSKIDNLEDILATQEKQNEIYEIEKQQLTMIERMACYITTDYKLLSRKYPEGYFLFATNKFNMFPADQKIKQFSLKWEESEVEQITDTYIIIFLKNFVFNPTNAKFVRFTIVLERKIGAVADGIYFRKTGMYVELLEDKKDGIIYVIGFKKLKVIPKSKRKPKTFLKKLNLMPTMGSLTITGLNFSGYDLLITSAWQYEDS